VADLWCERVDAVPDAQYVGVVRDAQATARYVGAYLTKESQAPPADWRGHRFSTTRGYFPRGAAAARKEAQDWIKRRALEGRLSRSMGLSGPELLAVADLESEWIAETKWEIVEIETAQHGQSVIAPRTGFHGANR
jgi:hypothetical protein